MEQQEAVRITDKRGKNKVTEPAPEPNLFYAEAEEPVVEDIPAAPARRAVATCFGVIMELDGTLRATGDITELASVQPHRLASFHDMYTASAHLQKDIVTEETAMRVLNGLQQLQQQALSAMEQARVQQQMSGLNLTGM